MLPLAAIVIVAIAAIAGLVATSFVAAKASRESLEAMDRLFRDYADRLMAKGLDDYKLNVQQESNLDENEGPMVDDPELSGFQQMRDAGLDPLEPDQMEAWQKNRVPGGVVGGSVGDVPDRWTPRG